MGNKVDEWLDFGGRNLFGRMREGGSVVYSRYTFVRVFCHKKALARRDRRSLDYVS